MPLEPTENDLQKEQFQLRKKFEDFRRSSTGRRASSRCLVEAMADMAVHKQRCPTRTRNTKWPGWACHHRIDLKLLCDWMPTVASSEPDKGSLAWTRNSATRIAGIKLHQHVLEELGFGRVSKLHHVLRSRWSTGMEQDLEQVVEEVSVVLRAARQRVPVSRTE